MCSWRCNVLAGTQQTSCICLFTLAHPIRVVLIARCIEYCSSLNVKFPENLHPFSTPTDAFLFQTPHSRNVTRPVKRVWAKFTSRPLKGINYTLELTAIFLCFLHDQTGPHLLQRIDLNKKEMKSCWANFYFFFVGQEGQQPPQESIKTHAGKQLKLHQP